jgi:hypothetical protein
VEEIVTRGVVVVTSPVVGEIVGLVGERRKISVCGKRKLGQYSQIPAGQEINAQKMRQKEIR